MKTFSIKTIERKYPNQWVLIEVTDTIDGAPSRGIVLKASARRDVLVKEIEAHHGKKLYFFYCGIPASTDTAFALLSSTL